MNLLIIPISFAFPGASFAASVLPELSRDYSPVRHDVSTRLGKKGRLIVRARLRVLVLLAALLLTCATTHAQLSPPVLPDVEDSDGDDMPGMVAPDDFELPYEFQRRSVYYRTLEPSGTIIIETGDRYLYLVQGNNSALRYGIGVGRTGFSWAGLLRVSRKAEWPDWRPPPEMIERQPYLPRFMAGGPGNPMGARALYLGNTVYRIHGTNQPETIGKAVSSGCFRLRNTDIEDLYARVAVGAKVVVRH